MPIITTTKKTRVKSWWFYNYGDETQTIAAGERIVQGIFTKYFLIDNDDTTDQRTGGTGSTNK